MASQDEMPDLPWEVEVDVVDQWRRQNRDFLLLDVREPDEHAFAHIEGAMLLPMSELRVRFAELEAHRTRHIVVYCHHGGRSLRVTQGLRSQGFRQVQNMAGGIEDWSLRIDPSIPRY